MTFDNDRKRRNSSDMADSLARSTNARLFIKFLRGKGEAEGDEDGGTEKET